MEAQIAVAPIELPGETLGDRLRELQRGGDEGRVSFLGRAAALAAEYAEYELTPDDMNAARSRLPRWQLNDVRLHDKEWGLARRFTKVNERHEAIFDEHRTSRRIVGKSIESDEIMLLARQALTGSDLAAMFEIEKVANSRPGAVKAKSDIKVYHRPERSEPEKPVLLLNEEQKDALWLLGLPRAEAAKKLDITQREISGRIKNAQIKNNMTRKDLLTAAMDEGRIDMSLLPESRSFTMTKQEQKILEEHIFSTSEDTAEALTAQGMPTSTRTVGLRWTSIYAKMGMRGIGTRTHAFLIARRDGLIES